MCKIKRVTVPEGVQGDWRVERFTVTEADANLCNLRCAFHPGQGDRIIQPATYTRLTRNGTVVMSDTRAELIDHYDAIWKATGAVLINGLGIGLVLANILAKPDVTDVTVIEKSDAVMKLVAPHYLNGGCPTGKKLDIIHADAFTWKPPKGKRYNAVWNDVWDNICTDNWEDMKKLHRKYGRRCGWQGSWSRDQLRRLLREERNNPWR